MVQAAQGFGFASRESRVDFERREGFGANPCGGGDVIRRGEQVYLRQQGFPRFGIGCENGVGLAVRFFDEFGVMDGLSVNELKREVTGNFGIAAAGVGSEVRFGEDSGGFGLGEERAKDFKGLAAANYEMRAPSAGSRSRAWSPS